MFFTLKALNRRCSSVRRIPRMGNCHTPCSDKRLIAYVAEIKGLYIYRCIKGRQLPRRLRAVGTAKAVSSGFRRPQTAKSLILGGLRKMVVEKPCKNGKIAYLSRLQGRLNPQKSPNCQGISIFLVGEAGKAGFSWSRPKTVCLCFVAAGTNYSTSGHELSCQLPRTIVSAGTNVNQRLIHPYASCDGLTANGIFGYTSYNISLRKRILDGLYTYTSSRQHQEAVGGNT